MNEAIRYAALATGKREGLSDESKSLLEANPDLEPKLAAMVSDCKEKMDAQREALAAYAHEAWAGWMRHQATVRRHAVRIGSRDEWHFSTADVERWLRLERTPYEALTEAEKASDRAQADRILAILRGEGGR